MRLTPWQLYPKAFPDDFCDEVINIANQTGTKGASVGNGNYDKEIRDSLVCFLDPSNTRHISQPVYDIVSHANSISFGVDISACNQMQYTEYHQGQYYGIHTDTDFIKTPDSPIFDRKLSISILLCDASEFEGGNFIIEGMKVDLEQKGAAVVFPSLLRHEVTKVTAGVRKSLVSWIEGPMWR